MTTEQRIFLPQAKTPFKPRASVNGMVYAVKGMCYRLSVAYRMGNRVSSVRASLADDATYQWGWGSLPHAEVAEADLCEGSTCKECARRHAAPATSAASDGLGTTLLGLVGGAIGRENLVHGLGAIRACSILEDGDLLAVFLGHLREAGWQLTRIGQR
jgi:hypothetical protein